MFQKIPGNVERYSGECLKRFRGMFEEIRGMFQKIPGNVSKDSRECWQRFSRMLKKIERFILQFPYREKNPGEK